MSILDLASAKKASVLTKIEGNVYCPAGKNAPKVRPMLRIAAPASKNDDFFNFINADLAQKKHKLDKKIYKMFSQSFMVDVDHSYDMLFKDITEELKIEVDSTVRSFWSESLKGTDIYNIPNHNKTLKYQKHLYRKMQDRFGGKNANR